MTQNIVNRVNVEGAEHVVMVISMQSRSFWGWLWMWMHMPSFGKATKNAEGCNDLMAGVVGPTSIMMVSYWSNQAALKKFVGSPQHVKWMRYIYKNPGALRLHNETYGAPSSANFINEARGYAKSLAQDSEMLKR